MSLSKFIVLFVLSFSCFTFIANMKIQKFSEAVEKKVELNDAIDRALDAAVDDSILTTDDYTVEVSRKKCSDNFYRALYAAFGILDGSEEQQNLLDLYIPAFAMVDDNGITVQHSEIIDGELTKVWGQKRVYAKKYSQQIGAVANQYIDYTIAYTLGRSITVIVGDNQYTGVWSSLKDLYSKSTKPEDSEIKIVMNSTIFESENSFSLEKNAAIADTIIDTFEYYVNRHNDVAKQYGITYTFTIPSSMHSSLARSIETTSFLCLFQGYPLGQGTSEEYNTFALAGVRAAKNSQYAVAKGADGQLYYHKLWCEDTKNATTIYNSKRKCAQHGALPCEKCRP